MGQMADGGGYKVMLCRVQNKGDGAHSGHQVAIAFQPFGGGFFRRGKDVIGIFQKAGFGIGIPEAFAPGHGMAADELGRKPQCFDMLVDAPFYASYIGEGAGRGEELL